MRLLNNTKLTFIYTACLMLAWFAPLKVYAEDATALDPAAVTQTQTAPAPTEPIDSATTETESQPSYTYDAATGRWSTDDWQYDAASNTYIPTPTQVIQEQPAAVASEPSPEVPSAENSLAIGQNVETTTTIANALTSLATTGDAGIFANTGAGSALTGDASAVATIINNVNSTVTNTNNQEAATFVSDVMGDVNGDILLQPMLLKAMMEANALSSQSNQQVTNTTSITNDITLGAQSGDANVDSNTSAGDATTGSANTVADVVNIVNSMVAANQSFIGTINIYGNLNGDILIAPDFIPQLLESNAAGDEELAATTVNSRDTQAIVNNVALAAESGAALVGSNTAAGDAISGAADTNLVIFNLSGHEIVASNSLLVFINVLGTWVGVIVDAPTGATAAAIADGVSVNSKIDPSLELNIVNEAAITNNIALNSKSGDATVTNNTLAGNATSGNATASANIANIANSQLGLSGWFGILFINVFGTWTGSFGVDTLAGNVLNTAPDSLSATEPESTKVVRFISRTPAAQPLAKTTVLTPKAQDVEVTQIPVQQAAQAMGTRQNTGQAMTDIPSQESYVRNQVPNIPLAVGSLVITGISIYVLRRFML